MTYIRRMDRALRSPGSVAQDGAAADPGRPPPDTEAVLRFLQDPATHVLGGAAATDTVQTIETHMAWVFLIGDRALKLKKPVRYAFLDFSTATAREAACREELRLNVRLAPQVYLGLDALRWDGHRLSLEPASRPAGDAVTFDWLVRMRRLPAERMLDALIIRDAVGPADIGALVSILVAFYRRAQPIPASAAPRWIDRRRQEQAITRELLLRPQLGVAAAAVAVLDRFDRAFDRHRGALEQRLDAGRVVDGHGDLRPEHVCLLQPPVVIDALEFDAALRRVDPFEEIALLGLECDALGAAWIGPQLVDGLALGLNDPLGPRLVPLYRAYRALLRARLALAHLLDARPRHPQRWVPLAQRFIDLARQALDTLDAVEAPSPPAGR